MRSTTGRLRFQPSRPAPSLPHQVPNEHAENAGIPRASTAKKSLALDPLENNIDVKRTPRIARVHVALGGKPARSPLISNERITLPATASASGLPVAPGAASAAG